MILEGHTLRIIISGLFMNYVAMAQRLDCRSLDKTRLVKR